MVSLREAAQGEGKQKLREASVGVTEAVTPKVTCPNKTNPYRGLTPDLACRDSPAVANKSKKAVRLPGSAVVTMQVDN